jgi:hypothetical protein
MYRGLVIALCLIAALAMIAGAVRAWYGSARGTNRIGRAVQRPLERCVGVSRFAAEIMFGTANTPSALQKGWALIDRTNRARRAVRIAVR